MKRYLAWLQAYLTLQRKRLALTEMNLERQKMTHWQGEEKVFPATFAIVDAVFPVTFNLFNAFSPAKKYNADIFTEGARKSKNQPFSKKISKTADFYGTMRYANFWQ